MKKHRALIYTTRGGEDILFPVNSNKILTHDVQFYGKVKKAGTRVDFDGTPCEVIAIQGGFILKCTHGKFHLYVGKVPYGTDYAPYAKVGTYASIEAASKSYIFAKVLTEGVVVNGPALKNAIATLQKSRSGLRHDVTNLYSDAAVLTTSGVIYLDPYHLIELPEIGCHGMAVDLRDTDVKHWSPKGDVTLRFTDFGWKADDTHKDFFRNYPDGPWGSWRAHSILLSNGRYKKLHGLDWKGWADGLQNLGYATDQRYAAALKGIIQRYELHRFDN